MIKVFLMDGNAPISTFHLSVLPKSGERLLVNIKGIIRKYEVERLEFYVQPGEPENSHIKLYCFEVDL